MHNIFLINYAFTKSLLLRFNQAFTFEILRIQESDKIESNFSFCYRFCHFSTFCYDLSCWQHLYLSHLYLWRVWQFIIIPDLLGIFPRDSRPFSLHLWGMHAELHDIQSRQKKDERAVEIEGQDQRKEGLILLATGVTRKWRNNIYRRTGAALI